MRNGFKNNIIKIRARIILFFLLSSQAFSVTLQWGQVSDTDVRGYLIYYGTESGCYTTVIDVGDTSQYSVTDIENGVKYYFAVSAYDKWGNESPVSQEVEYESINTSKTTGVDKEKVPGNFELGQNYPNPFNPVTKIKYKVSKPGRVVLAIYNIYGQKVRTLVDEYIINTNAPNEVVWDSTDDAGNRLSSGVYLYSLVVGNEIATRRMILNK